MVVVLAVDLAPTLRLDDVADLRRAAEALEDEPTDRGVLVGRGEAHAGRRVELVEPQVTRHDPGVGPVGLHGDRLGVVLVEDLSDDLLGDVLERDDAGEAAVLVDDDGQLPVAGADLLEHPGQRRTRRHDGRLGSHRPDGGGRPQLRRHGEHLGDAGDADDVVTVGAGHREARPARVEQLDETADRVVGVHGLHPHARGHDVAGVELAEAQTSLEDLGQVVVEQAAGV